MAEQLEGVFTSHLDEAAWEPDEETGGLVHMLRADEAVQAGLWKAGPVAGAPIDVELEADETLYVLAGSGRLEVDGGPPIELHPGAMVSLSRGARTRWVVDESFLEFWVYGSP